ncbi:unnamed protein product [Sphenostylis stenocarpa]|uniref:Uncharacterized protein n=1 Tax=Sphenostylis stenocarpa TaxID=92480 RepID=A0AA86SSW5_9FABA|nr:unnamed protein product [Sphenostylis stenocarpa]
MALHMWLWGSSSFTVSHDLRLFHNLETAFYTRVLTTSPRGLAEAINYNNYTVRVVDPGLLQHNCSSLPLNFISRSNFSDTYSDDVDPYQAGLRAFRNWGSRTFQHIMFMNCNHSVSDNDKYVDTAHCVKWDSKGYAYAVAGDLNSEEFEVGCEVKLVGLSSWLGLETDNNRYSYTAMHRGLAYGFEISWVRLACKKRCLIQESYCYFDSSRQKLRCQIVFLNRAWEVGVFQIDREYLDQFVVSLDFGKYYT